MGEKILLVGAKVKPHSHFSHISVINVAATEVVIITCYLKLVCAIIKQ